MRVRVEGQLVINNTPLRLAPVWDGLGIAAVASLMNKRPLTSSERPKADGQLSTSFAEMRTVRIYNLCAITRAYVAVIRFAQEAASAG